MSSRRSAKGWLHPNISLNCNLIGKNKVRKKYCCCQHKIMLSLFASLIGKDSPSLPSTAFSAISAISSPERRYSRMHTVFRTAGAIICYTLFHLFRSNYPTSRRRQNRYRVSLTVSGKQKRPFRHRKTSARKPVVYLLPCAKGRLAKRQLRADALFMRIAF